MEIAKRFGSAEICFVLWFLLSSIVRHINALSITVHNMECVSESVLYEGDTISGNFVVIENEMFWTSEHPGIEFFVTSPEGNIVHSLKETTGDKFEFKAPRSGVYKFCFRNPSSNAETIAFYIHVGHIPNQHDLTKDEHLDPMNVKIAELREALESVTAEQRYLKARDARHRYTNESTRKRVIFYTLTEYILLAVASGFQVIHSSSVYQVIWIQQSLNLNFKIFWKIVFFYKK